MALLSNKPDLAAVKRRLLGVDLTALDPTAVDEALEELLEQAIADVEDKASTFFDGIAKHEIRDGNGTAALSTFYWPITSVEQVKVELPVLALNRVYTPNEVKVYRRQGRIMIFTFKLAAEQASLYLDQQITGNIFPNLPQCVFVDYTCGFPRVDDPDTPTYTSLDGGTAINGSTVLTGDQRDPRERNLLRALQKAATCSAAATFLGSVARNEIGLVQSVSFDGFSKSFNPQAFAGQIEALQGQYDAAMERLTRRFILSSTG